MSVAAVQDEKQRPGFFADESRGHWIAAISLLFFFTVFFIYPLWRVTAAGFEKKTGGFTFAYVELIFSDPVLVRGLLNALGVAAITTFCSLLLSLPLAIVTVRYEFPGRAMLSTLLLCPLILPPFVGAIGVRLILSRLGPLTVLLGYGGGAGIDWLGRYRLAGIIAVETLHLYPVILLNLQAALSATDPAMELAAANLGASHWTILRRITLPLIRPGLFAGCTLTAIWSFTELGTPLMFDFSTITPVQLYRQITDVADNPLPFALMVVTLAISAGLYALGKVLLGREFNSTSQKSSSAFVPRRLYGWSATAAGLFVGGVVMIAILPHLSVILTSLTATGQWYRSVLPREFTLSHFSQALLDDLALPSIYNSLTYASGATVLAVIVGVTAAIVIIRSRLWVVHIIDALAMLPLAVPGLVLAFGYLAVSVSLQQRYQAKLPLWLNVQEKPIVFLIIAYAARRVPYVVRSAAAGLQQLPVDLELAARNLGASRLTVLRRITIPLIYANLIAGALLAFAFSLLEVGDSLILAQRSSYFPITRAILELSGRLGDGVYIAAALGVWAMALLAVTLLATNQLLGRRMGAIFRA